jgi:hypothetical protein
MLGPADILEGATPRPGTRCFVIGCYDSRITFYSQQVRALMLVHALHNQGYLGANPRIAVIGGGAAGVTAAAAAALVTTGEVHLFERHSELMPLQSVATRRHLDPHIYDWPDEGTDDPGAGLPILDWEKGPTRTVRQDIDAEFRQLVQRIGARLQLRCRHDVTAVESAGASLTVNFERDWRPGDPITGTNPADPASVAGPASLRVADRDRYDMVLLTLGFGLEAHESIPGIANRSYWLDGGIPSGEIAGDAHPRFLISGNGDGALIDLVAAASADFSHANMIRTISTHPGIEELFDQLKAIDTEARAANDPAGRYDFIADYDAQLLAPAVAMGLVSAVRQQLKPGVQLILQTQDAQAFTTQTSALNRFAAWLVIQACNSDAQASFRHVHCTKPTPVKAPDPKPHAAHYWFDCGGKIIGANEVIVRWGTGRGEVQAPFANLLDGFKEAHDAWLERHGEATRVPYLSRAAYSLFKEAALAAGISLSQFEARAMAEMVPLRGHVRPSGGAMRWAGQARPETVTQAWDGSSWLQLACGTAPANYGPVAAALIRLAAHSDHVTLVADPALWNSELQRLTTASPQAQGMPAPQIVNKQIAGASTEPVTLQTTALAATLHHAMDRWVLHAIDHHLQNYCASGRDAGWRINIEAHKNVRAAMRQIWNSWHVDFLANPQLLARFLQLTICALDSDADIDVASVLVGPNNLDVLIRGTAVACMIASTWAPTAPHGVRPGNLRRSRAAGDWHGHSCVASMIDGRSLAVCAVDFMWQTEFVILAMPGSLQVASEAEVAFSFTDPAQPSLSNPAGAGQLFMTIDNDLLAAAKAGPAELAALLERIEQRHFEDRKRAILPIDQEDAA